MMKTHTFFLPLSDGKRLALHITVPEGGARAVVVLSHGMAEYAQRYERFADILAAAGYAFYAGDHRAHGKTAGSEEALGYLGDGVGYERVAEDIHEVVLFAKKENPGKKIFLLGHSFGSFIAQAFIERYGTEIDGCILSGTAGPRLALVKTAKLLASLVCLLFGGRRKSRFLDNLAFGSYNKNIVNPKTKFDWLSRDESEVSLYVIDPYCGFLMSASFFRELFSLLSCIHTKKALARIPKSLPVYIFSGDDDPVGSYGKTVSALADEYRKNGLFDLTLKLYPGARHEMLNETNKDEVAADIMDWLVAHT